MVLVGSMIMMPVCGRLDAWHAFLSFLLWFTIALLSIIKEDAEEYTDASTAALKAKVEGLISQYDSLFAYVMSKNGQPIKEPTEPQSATYPFKAGYYFNHESEELLLTRRRLGLTQKELGDKLGYSASHISSMENGYSPVNAEAAAFILKHKNDSTRA